MKMVSVFSEQGDEIRIPDDMLDYYAAIGWVVEVEDEEFE
jgi:hypothetical protein